MDNLWIELVRQVPAASAVIGTVFLFLRHLERLEDKRDANAKEAARERREHEVTINTMWANSIKSVVDQNDRTATMIVEKLVAIDKAADERYERLRKTDDLIKAIESQKNEMKKGSHP